MSSARASRWRTVRCWCRALLARYEEARILVESGMHKPGVEPGLDRAVAARPALSAFLRQPSDLAQPPAETAGMLAALAREHG